ncbi:hypothetical protein [Cytobacillus kochii]|uniref:hypothetical protein n=1 Tax=Cytobacillus kochii TaxID=859143 RepID=UPI002480E851|nr:hypothetical protein [Cytobacillus kochii]
MADEMLRIAGRDHESGTAKAISTDENGNVNQWMKNQLDDVNDIIAIGDGSGAKLFTKTTPGIVQEKGQKTDNQVFNTNSDSVIPSLAGYYQPNSIDSVLSPLSIGALRATQYRTLITSPDRLRLTLSDTAPNPNGSDIKNSSGGNLATSDFLIRDNSWHTFIIPLSGWKNTIIHYSQDVNFDQPIRLEVYGVGAGGALSGKILAVQVPASKLVNIAIGSGEAGVGAEIGTSTVANNAYYNIPALNAGFDKVALYIKADVAPTSGKINNIMVVRTS